MQHKDRKLMEDICAYSERFVLLNKRSPYKSEIASEFGVAKSTVTRYLSFMSEKGMIAYDGRNIQTKASAKSNIGSSVAAIVGSICCGSPEEEQEQVEAYLTLPDAIFGSGEFYILRAKGDSMVDAGIEENDLIVIKKQTNCAEGDIVVALDMDNQNTLKRYAGVRNGMALLKYENAEKYPDKYLQLPTLIVQGVAQYVIKAL